MASRRQNAADSFENPDFGFSLPCFRSLVFKSPGIARFLSAPPPQGNSLKIAFPEQIMQSLAHINGIFVSNCHVPRLNRHKDF